MSSPIAQGTRTLGLDIGGANVKYALSSGETHSHAFPMWQDWKDLKRSLESQLQQLDWSVESFDAIALTMTGELADCFATRRQGVSHIVREVRSAFAGIPLQIYSLAAEEGLATNGQADAARMCHGHWVDAERAVANPWDVAAANWHALATWLALPEVAGLSEGLVIDVGSTTTDIIPVRAGAVATTARTDRDRLAEGQLVYSGIERTCVSMLVDELRVGTESVPVMREQFADVADAYVLLGEVAEDVADTQTCDGAPRTRENSATRLARLVGEDGESLPMEKSLEMARQIVDTQVDEIVHAIERQELPDGTGWQIVFSGHGHPIARRLQKRLGVPDTRWVELQQVVGEEGARAAPALAVAQLLSARLQASSAP